MIDLGIREYNYTKYKVMIKRNKSQEEFCCLVLAVACSGNQVLKARMPMMESTVTHPAAANLKLAGKDKAACVSPRDWSILCGPEEQSSTGLNTFKT